MRNKQDEAFEISTTSTQNVTLSKCSRIAMSHDRLQWSICQWSWWSWTDQLSLMIKVSKEL